MNTDVALTSLNPNILWAAAYSDDRAALASADQILSGDFQEAQDSSHHWSVGEECKYHGIYKDGTDPPKLNPKRPKVLEYRTKSDH